MKQLVFSIIVLTITLQKAYAGECILSGKWAPNIEKTKASILKSKKLSKEKKEYLMNITAKISDAVVENSCSSSTVYKDGVIDTVELISVKTNGNVSIAEFYDKAQKRVVETKSVLVGECYYVEIPELDVNDYYCRIE